MPVTSPPSRDNHFNLLRLVLALLVLLGHAPELCDGDRRRELLTLVFGTISFGELAVDAFFLLSGYLIVQSWRTAPQPLAFLSKRVLRIYPGFIVASLVCGFVVGPLGADAAAYFHQFWLRGFVTGVALLQMPVVPPVFVGQPWAAVNGPMWTIGLEFACYVSVLVLGLAGAIVRPRAWLALAALLLAALLAYTLRDLPAPPLLRLATFFFAGGALQLYPRLYGARMIWPRRRVAVLAALLLAAMFSPRLAEPALATLGGVLLLRCAFADLPPLARLRHLPDVSYGVYLYGWPVQKLLLWYWPGMSPWLLFALAAPLAIGCGAASWFAVEKPFMALRGRHLGRPLPGVIPVSRTP